MFANKAWTITVWRDEESLSAFLRSDTHKTVVSQVSEMLVRGRTVAFVLPSHDLPLDWDVAERRLADDGHEITKPMADQR